MTDTLSSSSNESQSQLNTPLCFIAPSERPAAMKNWTVCSRQTPQQTGRVMWGRLGGASPV